MKNKMTFPSKTKFRMFVGAALFFLGLVSFILSLGMFPNIQTSGMQDFTKGFYSGLGCGLMAAGVVCFVRNLLLLKNPEKMKKAKLEEEDERNIFLYNKTAYLGGLICFFGVYIATLIAGLVNAVVFSTLLWVLCGALIILFTTYLICRKVY